MNIIACCQQNRYVRLAICADLLTLIKWFYVPKEKTPKLKIFMSSLFHVKKVMKFEM